MTVDELKQALGRPELSDYALAQVVERTRQRVSQWRARGFVPEGILERIQGRGGDHAQR